MTTEYPFSYQKAIDLLKEACDLHAAINTTTVGQSYAVGQSANIAYPLAYVELDTVASITDGAISYPMAFQVLDKVQDNLNDYKETLDRAQNIARDIIALLYRASINKQIGMAGNISASMATMVGVYPDNVIGWRVELTIQHPLTLDKCDIITK